MLLGNRGATDQILNRVDRLAANFHRQRFVELVYSIDYKAVLPKKCLVATWSPFQRVQIEKNADARKVGLVMKRILPT